LSKSIRTFIFFLPEQKHILNITYFTNIKYKSKLISTKLNSMKTILNFKMLKVSIATIALLFSIMSVAKAGTVTANLITDNWSNTTAWAGGVVPVAGDDVIIPSGAVITVDASTASLLSLTINDGGQLIVSSGFTVTATTINLDGILTNAGNVIHSGTMTVGATGIYQHNYTTTAGTVPTATWATGSTIEIIGYTSYSPAGSITGMNQTFYNFIWNCTNQTTTAFSLRASVTNVTNDFTVTSTGTGSTTFSSSSAVAVTIGGDYTQTGGIWILTGSGTKSISINGNFSISGGSLNFSSGAGKGTLNVAGDFTQIGGTMTETAGGSGALAFNGSSVQYITTDVTLTNTITTTINAGSAVDFGTHVFTTSGSFTITDGAIFRTAHASGIDGSIVAGSTSYGTAATYSFNGAGPQITGTTFPSTVSFIIVCGTSDLTLSGDLTAAQVEIDPNANLNLGAGQTISVSVSFTVYSTAAGTGSFIDNGGTLAGAGTYTVQNYLTGSGGGSPDGRYWYVGSPVTSALSGVFPAMGSNRLWYYNEVGGGYSEIDVNGINLTPQQGFVARLGTSTTVNFSGTFNTGTIGLADNLTRTATGSYDGYNLVSNPYPSAINFDVAGTGLTRTNLETTIWYRSNGVFPTYNFSTGATANLGQQYVPAMQAFWVRVATGHATGTLIMDNTSRVFSSQPFYKTGESNLFRLSVSNGTANDETVVGFYPNSLETYENTDSYKMFSTDEEIPQIYTLTSDNENVIINGYPELTAYEERVVSLGFKTSVAGSYTLNATNLDVFDANIPVYLEDAQQNIYQDLRQSTSYSFSSAVVDDVNRFKLHFGNTTITSVPSLSENAASVYAVNNNIYINTPKTATIEVYDLLGNLIKNQQSSLGLNKLQLNVETGIYIVKVQTDTQLTIQKVMLSK
jgi:hypothetical protein